jgi:hypothetical protein
MPLPALRSSFFAYTSSKYCGNSWNCNSVILPR